jgi:hypothetical protein
MDCLLPTGAANMSFMKQGLKCMFSMKDFYFTLGIWLEQQNLNIPAS